MKKKISILLLCAAFLPLASCEGPAGPPGNANVFAFNFTFQPRNGVVSGPVLSQQFTVPDITPSIVDFGAVIVYHRDENTWTALPFTFGVENPEIPAVDYTVTLGYAYELHFLEVFFEASTDEVNLRTLPDRQMKAVIIDGFALRQGEVDWTQYKAVQRRFNLPN